MIDDDDEDIEPKTDEAIAPTGDMPTKPKSDTPAGPKLVVDNEEALDEDEKEFRALRQELPGVQGGSAAGIVAISVGKAPNRNAFFRTHPDFHPIIPIVDLEVGMEKQFFAVTSSMVEPLASIGFSVTNHTLYLTMTSTGSVRIVPVRCANSDGEQNEWSRTKELGLRAGMKSWVRLYADQENKCYQVFPAPVGRFADAVWPELSHAKVFRLGFRDKGRLIDSTQHPLYLKWTARDHAE